MAYEKGVIHREKGVIGSICRSPWIFKITGLACSINVLCFNLYRLSNSKRRKTNLATNWWTQWTIKPLRGQIFPLGVGGEHVNNELLLAKPQMLMLLKIFPSNMIAQTANVHKHLSMCAVHTVHKAHISFMWMQLCVCALYIQTLYAFSNPLYVSFHLSPQGHVLKDAVNTGCRLH